MSNLIALTSTGPLSGKSTLARYLHEQFGYLWADHSRTLVEKFVEAFNGEKGKFLTVDMVLENKEYWRSSLQDYGNRMGYNTDYDACLNYMGYTLKRAGAFNRAGVVRGKNVVYEPFRGELQAEVLRDLGFYLVQLEIPEDVRERRAKEKGANYTEVRASMLRAPELECGIERPDLILDATKPVHELSRIIVGLGVEV